MTVTDSLRDEFIEQKKKIKRYSTAACAAGSRDHGRVTTPLRAVATSFYPSSSSSSIIDILSVSK